MTDILITVDNQKLRAKLNDSVTARLLLERLPLEASANVWGDEIYFEVPVQADLEPDASDLVSLGALAYWPPGNAFCIFYGATPVSRQGEPRAASPVNPLGELTDAAASLRGTRHGATVRIEVADGR